MPKEAEMLQYVFSLDIKSLIISIVVIAAASVALWALIKKIQEITGIETKSMREKRLMNENFKSISGEIDSLKESQKQDCIKMDEMMKAINKLSTAITHRDIDDMRWTILDFANAAQGGRKYTSEAYIHIIEVYDEYEQLLKENGMENGRVDMAINFVKERYEVGIRDGFPA